MGGSTGWRGVAWMLLAAVACGGVAAGAGDGDAVIDASLASLLRQVDDAGLIGADGDQRSVAYELCVPEAAADQVRALGIQAVSRSPGRSGCGEGELLVIGETADPGGLATLLRLVVIPGAGRVRPAYFE